MRNKPKQTSNRYYFLYLTGTRRLMGEIGRRKLGYSYASLNWPLVDLLKSSQGASDWRRVSGWIWIVNLCWAWRWYVRFSSSSSSVRPSCVVIMTDWPQGKPSVRSDQMLCGSSCPATKMDALKLDNHWIHFHLFHPLPRPTPSLARLLVHGAAEMATTITNAAIMRLQVS